MTIQERINSFQTEGEMLDRNFKTKRLLCNMGIIGCAASGVFMMFSAPLVGIPLVSMAVGCISSKLTNYDNTCIKINTLNEKMKKLGELSKGDLDISDKTQKTRATKLTAIQKKESVANNNTASKKFTSKLATAGLVGATILGIAIPGPLSFVAPVLTAVKIGRDKKYTDSLRESENTSAVASGLRYEYSLARNARLKGNNPKKTTSKAPTQQQVKSAAKKTQVQPPRKQATSNKVNEDIVDQYIRNIENNQRMTDTEKQMLKKYISNYTKRK